MHLKEDNKPLESGIYFAANVAHLNNRLEIEKVFYLHVTGSVMLIESEDDGYAVSDFDYWSDRQTS